MIKKKNKGQSKYRDNYWEGQDSKTVSSPTPCCLPFNSLGPPKIRKKELTNEDWQPLTPAPDFILVL